MKTKTFFEVPYFKVEESQKDTAVIEGIALRGDQTSRNGVFYPFEEVSKAAFSLRGKHINLNHSERVQDIIGSVETTRMLGKDLLFRGIVTDTPFNHGILEMLRQGLIRRVSIEAYIPSFKTTARGREAHSIDLTGLSMVTTNGVVGADILKVENTSNVVYESFDINPKIREIVRQGVLAYEKNPSYYEGREDLFS